MDDESREDVSPEFLAELRALILARRKIDAVKRYRQVTGCGLKDAKDWVEDCIYRHLPGEYW